MLLEDMGLNLQSMMASPHVKPFLEEVRAWEQRLSTIGECSAMWMVVQRKWMYLESIFVGSDDIRQQLPAEAKRFDGVDKAWLKIMAETAKNTNVLEACRWVQQQSLATGGACAWELHGCDIQVRFWKNDSVRWHLLDFYWCMSG